MANIDWDQLRTEAIGAMKRAYAPYSKFPVGVAAKTDDGRIVSGCNVENASYGLGLCAECGLISNLVLGGRSIIKAIYCVDINGNALSPCGRCRQLLWEHSTPDTQFMTPDGPAPLSTLLPWAFGPENL
ncbi:MAG: cytidine deaminase [Actinobacteria bacterium]|nr:cytidine deaminase [Actinomycetota bacterium]